MRILHLADVHLDTSFQGRSTRIRSRLRRATHEAFRGAVSLALESDVHVVLIAGDLFDGDRLSFETEGFLMEELERLTSAGVPVVYATGNHDPGSVRESRRALAWPEGVTVVRDASPVRIAIRGRDGAQVGWVVAAGHATTRETRDLAAAFPAPEDPLPHVALLHTQVVGSRDADAHEPYAPTALETLTGSGYDYWALGHVHLRQSLADLPGVHYPGNLQGRTPRESGAKGAILAEVDRGSPPKVEFVPLAPIRWEELVLEDPIHAGSLEALIRLVEDRWRDARADDPDPAADWMVRVVVQGATPLWRELAVEDDRAHLASQLEGPLGALEVEVRTRGVHAPVNVEDHRGREDVLGAALGMVRALRNGDLELPGLSGELAAARGGEGNEGPYLRDLLEGAEGEIVARLLKDRD